MHVLRHRCLRRRMGAGENRVTESCYRPGMKKLPKTRRKLQGFGQIMAAVPDFRVIREEVSDLLAQGGTVEEARALAISRGRDLGLLGPRVIIPSLSRTYLRMEFREFLHKIADAIADRARGKRLGDIAEDLYSRIGIDEWFADYIVGWAQDPSGEPGEFFPTMGGRVWTQKVGFGEEKADAVMVFITPLSDPNELLKEAYEECHRVLPEGVWSQYGSNVEAHRLLRLKTQEPSRSWGDVAEILLDESEPHLREMGAAVFAERRESERERIEQQMRRFWKEYADSFFAELSADSE